MFRVVVYLIKKLLHVRDPAKKPDKQPETGNKVDRDNQAKSGSTSLSYNILIVGGLSMLLLAMTYGGVYGGLFIHGLEEKHTRYMDEAFKHASEKQTDEATEDIKRFEEIQLLQETIASSHAHLALIGLIAVAVATNIQRVQLDEVWKFAAAVALLFGGILLPVGLIVETQLSKIGGTLMAVAGGTAIIGSLAVYLWGAIIQTMQGNKVKNRLGKAGR